MADHQIEAVINAMSSRNECGVDILFVVMVAFTGCNAIRQADVHDRRLALWQSTHGTMSLFV